MYGRALVTAVLLSTALLARRADAQPQAIDPRLEIFGTLSATAKNASGVLVSSYSPPLLFDGPFTSTGNQEVGFSQRPAVGFEAGANLFLNRRAGLQLFVDRASAALPGTSTPYAVSLSYISKQPPGNQSQVVEVRQSTPWPPTTGSLTQLTFGANAIVRLRAGRRVKAALFGGLSLNRLSGDLQPLGFTTFRLGGHSVLFQDEYRLAVSLEPAATIGFNAGGEINFAIGRHGALIVGYRYLGGPDVDMTVHPKAILNTAELIVQQSLPEVATQLTTGASRVGISGSRVLVGLKLRR